jgi:hypothetical protein
MTRKRKFIIIGFMITVALGLYLLYYFVWLHHMFIIGLHKS